MAAPKCLSVRSACEAYSATSSLQSSVCFSCAFRPKPDLARSRQQEQLQNRYIQKARFSSVPRRRDASLQSAPSQANNQGLASLGAGRFIAIRGNDATKFLQGLTTNNVNDGGEQNIYNNAFLNAQGRIEWDAMTYRLRDETDGSFYWLVEVDAGRRDGLLKHLMKHKLRSKVKLQKIDGMHSSILWGDDEQSLGTPLQYVAADPRLKQLGTRSLQETGVGPEEPQSASSDKTAYILRRYMHGIAEGPEELIPGSALPQESNLDYLNGVDFKKGCYVGQELTIRTQHTGVVRKRILPVQLYTGSVPSDLSYNAEAITPAALRAIADARTMDGPIDIVKAGAGSRRSAGKLLANVGNIGLALCRLETMTDLRISAEGGSYQPEDEFSLKSASVDESSGARDVKIKAFVPPWLREKIDADFQRKRARSEQASH